jgi:hypothetical protein
MKLHVRCYGNVKLRKLSSLSSCTAASLFCFLLVRGDDVRVCGDANRTHSAAAATYGGLPTCGPARLPTECDFLTISRKSTQFCSRTGIQRKADKCLLYYSLSLFVALLLAIPPTTQPSTYPPLTMQSFLSSPTSQFPPFSASAMTG